MMTPFEIITRIESMIAGVNAELANRPSHWDRLDIALVTRHRIGLEELLRDVMAEKTEAGKILVAS